MERPRRTLNPVFLTFAVILAVLLCPIWGCAGWFFFDGTVTYPRQREQAFVYEQLRRDHPADADERWRQHTTARDWPVTPPPMRSETDILTQYSLGSACTVTGLLFLGAAGVFAILAARTGRASQTGTSQTGTLLSGEVL